LPDSANLFNDSAAGEPLPSRIEPPHGDSADRWQAQRALWRLAAWGGAAAVALIAVAFASQTETGTQRIKLAFNGAPPPSHVAEVTAAERRTAQAQAEITGLEAKLSELSADRDRLNARLASLEHGLTEVTGSIAKQAETRAAPPPAPEPPAPVASAPPVAAAPAQSVATPAPAAPTVTPVSEPAKAPLAAEESKPEPEPPVAAAPPPAPSPAPKSERAAEAQPPAPAKLPKHEVMVDVPLPPVRVATIAIRQPPPAKPEYAVDLGGSISKSFLRAHWSELKANYGPLLTGLRPLVGHDRHFSLAPYRLLIGPLPSMTAARQLCVQFLASHTHCRPARFAGEVLVLP
jgi:hypothetical protein